MQLGDGSEGWQLTVSHQPFVTAAVEAEPEPARVERVIHPPMPGSHDVVADVHVTFLDLPRDLRGHGGFVMPRKRAHHLHRAFHRTQFRASDANLACGSFTPAGSPGLFRFPARNQKHRTQPSQECDAIAQNFHGHSLWKMDAAGDVNPKRAARLRSASPQ